MSEGDLKANLSDLPLEATEVEALLYRHLQFICSVCDTAAGYLNYRQDINKQMTLNTGGRFTYTNLKANNFITSIISNMCPYLGKPPY